MPRFTTYHYTYLSGISCTVTIHSACKYKETHETEVGHMGGGSTSVHKTVTGERVNRKLQARVKLRRKKASSRKALHSRATKSTSAVHRQWFPLSPISQMRIVAYKLCLDRCTAERGCSAYHYH